MNLLRVSRVRSLSCIAMAGMFVLVLWSGWRDEGIDRENYLQIYNSVVASEEWAIKLWYAKDVTFLFIITLVNYFSDEVKWSFLLVCFLSLTTKYYAIYRVAPRKLLPFILLYAVFLAPGLEFAAMRGGLAIGFFMLALVYRKEPWLFTTFSVLSILSHISMAIVICFGMEKFIRLLEKHWLSYWVIALTTAIVTPTLLQLFPHGVDYVGNEGALYAYALPLATLLITFMIFFGSRRTTFDHDEYTSYSLLRAIRTSVYGLIAIAIGMSDVVVTASTRYLEIAWCLLLVAAVMMFRKSYLNLLGSVMLVMYLSYINVSRLTWLALINPSVS